jgi:2-keto-3-deoxy-L-rhamnonate aldolase RhmA
MVTYKTLEEWVNKCRKSLREVELAHRNAEEQLALLANQRIAITAQIETLEQLMDIENNPPAVELPFASDKLEELFTERLSGPEDLSAEEVYKDRQEHAYLKEAVSAAKDIDAINREEQSAREDATLDT